MLSKLALAATAVMAQYDFDFGDLDLGDYDIDFSDINFDSLYDNGDTCIDSNYGGTADYCPTKCCAKNLKIDTTQWVGYNFWVPGKTYTQKEVDEKEDAVAYVFSAGNMTMIGGKEHWTLES